MLTDRKASYSADLAERAPPLRGVASVAERDWAANGMGQLPALCDGCLCMDVAPELQTTSSYWS